MNVEQMWNGLKPQVNQGAVSMFHNVPLYEY